MRKNYLFIFVFSFLFITASVAQNGFNYKFLIADNGSPLANTNVDVKFQIYQGATLVWEEEHTGVMTDTHGIASVFLGEGIQTGGSLTSFEDIDWSLDHTLNVFFDTGSGYIQLVSNEPFKYVPSAKFAKKSGEVDYENVNNAPEIFYLLNTTDVALNVNDDMYHLGKMALGINNFTEPARLYIYNNISGTQHNLFLNMDASDASNKTGITNNISGTGGGIIRGLTNYITAGGSGAHIGVRNHLSDNGDDTRVGVHNLMAGSGNGFITGVYSEITNTGNGYQYGAYNRMTGTGNGLHVGTVNSVLGSGSGDKYGTYNALYNSGSGNQYGVYNEMSNTGTATQYGSYTTYMYSTGSGDKYGYYVEIDNTLDGQHYGVYADVTKPGSYAGYFLGDVYVSGKLKSVDAGDADLKAYLFGESDDSGNIIANASTDGFSITYVSTGVYEVNFNNAFTSADSYHVIVTILGNTPGFVTVQKSNDKFTVTILNTSSNPMDAPFSFVVRKK